MTERPKTIVRLDPEHHTLLKKYSQAVDIPMSEILKDLLEKQKAFFEGAVRMKRKEEEEKEKQLMIL